MKENKNCYLVEQDIKDILNSIASTPALSDEWEELKKRASTYRVGNKSNFENLLRWILEIWCDCQNPPIRYKDKVIMIQKAIQAGDNNQTPYRLALSVHLILNGVTTTLKVPG